MMGPLLQTLSRKVFEGSLGGFGFIPVGVVKAIGEKTIIYVHADRVDDEYVPSITVFTHGHQVKPTEDGYCFDLMKQAGQFLCIRSLRFDAEGKPVAFLMESYCQIVPALRLVK